MSKMIAKFKVTSIERFNETSQNVTMVAVSENFDSDGNSDDNSFAKWTPSGHLTISITNPGLIDSLKEGQKYYLNFTPENIQKCENTCDCGKGTD